MTTKFSVDASAMKRTVLLSSIVFACLTLFSTPRPSQTGHTISISGNQFIRDGKPYQIISGAMHYPRIPREFWQDRFKKARAMGLNTVETYVFWNLHEPRRGVFDFSGNLDVAEFVRLAQQEGLNVILRPGPYICSEWDFGGMPAWLLADSSIKVRSKNPKFLAAADEYLMRIGHELASLQAARGGPIFMVQIENEYGSFGDDKEYLNHIHQTLIRAGFGESILYTADGPDRLAQGTLPGVLAVANFGPGEAKNAFAALQGFEPSRPLMTGEYWDGWFDSWGGKHAHTDAEQQAEEIKWMLSQGYSVNLYMFHGGTSFGFMNGANLQGGPKDTYQPQTSGYDYDAPLDEAGRPTKKYFLFRDAIAGPEAGDLPPLPAPLPSITIPQFKLEGSASLWDNLPPPVVSERPKPMEYLGQGYGYILYRTTVTGPQDVELIAKEVHDFANVYVNQKLQGQIDRRLKQDRVNITIPEGKVSLDILVENMGRVNYGPFLQEDRKGILGSVTLDGRELTGWKIHSLPMADLSQLKSWRNGVVSGPAFHRGSFSLKSVGDTFLDVHDLGMGVVWVNGHNLGRVWNIGPQESLYLPGPWLRTGQNEVIYFDPAGVSAPKLQGVVDPILENRTMIFSAPRKCAKHMKKLSGFLVGALLISAGSAFAQDEEPNRYKGIAERLESLETLPLTEWRYHADIAHPEDPSVNDADWPTVKLKEEWKTGARVLRRTVEIPEKINGYAVRGARVKLDLRLTSDDSMTVTVFSNGSLVERGNEELQQPILITENAQPGQKFVIAVRVNAGEVGTQFYQSQLRLEAAVNRPDPAILRDEILATWPMVEAFPEGKEGREAQLDAGIKAIDFAALDRGDQAAFDASLQQAQTKLKSLDPWLKQFTIRAAGNSHIDMAWLWPWTETVEVVRNTFRSALDLMREYPDFKFTMSSARTYVWMEEKYPDLFKEIRQRVREGRWEVIGGMWVEPDLNMPGGESLVRQVLVGKRYFRDKFGVDVKIGWNPDSFGYSWQLPQIYKKSGIDYFVTQKLTWAHEFTTFPHKLFWWESPDGSRILTYFPHDYGAGIDPSQLGKDLSIWVPSIYGTDPNQHSEILHLYGVGDHGGGPTRTMLDNADRWRNPDVVFPNLRFTTAKSFFDDLEKKLPSMKVPAWRDELYFEYHRGVMTTQAETKRRIRATEEVLLNAEKFAALATLYGRRYPSADFERGWKDLLFDDFHDIFPGSGIAVNYLDAKRNLEDVQRVGNGILDGSLAEIAAHIRSNGTGTPVAVFNPMAWPRNEVVEAEVQLPAVATAVEVVDSLGKAVPSQVLTNDRRTRRLRLLLKANVPSLGYRTYYVRAAAKAAPGPFEIKATDDSLENDLVRLRVDRQTGCMTSLFDKRSKTETLAHSETDTGGPKHSVCGNLLQTFRDKPKQWDAWNIDADFEKEHWDLDRADEVKLVENGSLRAVLRVKNHFQNSTFVRDITVTAGSPRVDVYMTADWHEKHILLKVAVPSSAHNEKATFEIPYGSIERPTTRNTPAEQAKFEVPALQWADLSDTTHGISLLNDCKYGYDAKGNVLRLSLLRSPEWPDAHADEGHHEFTYALYPHGGNWRDAMTVRRGYELNYPLLAKQIEKHDGGLNDEFSFLGVQADNVVLTAIKKNEDEDALILRYYEWAGKEADVRLQLPAGALAASETDLMERPTTGLSVKNDTVTVHTKPYEIKTVLIRFAPKPLEPKGRGRAN